jgi:type III secretory pathway component EscR
MMIAAWASKYRLGWLVYLLFAVVNLILSGFFALGYQFTA